MKKESRKIINPIKLVGFIIFNTFAIQTYITRLILYAKSSD